MLSRKEKPKIFNSDQGSRFASAAFTGPLTDVSVAISMDGRGRRGQRLHRAAVAIFEVRGHLPQGLRRRPRGCARRRLSGSPFTTNGVLIRRWPTARQWRSGARRSPAPGCGHDGQRIRVAHMPTATEADAVSRCVIKGNPERSRFQLTNRIKRSRCAGPFQSCPGSSAMYQGSIGLEPLRSPSWAVLARR